MKNNVFYCFASGSKGNCGLLCCGETKILIDLGISVLKLKRAMEKIGLEITDLDAVLLTHEHSDHVKGVKTFLKKHDVPIYATFGTAAAICEALPEAVGRIRGYYGDAALEIGAVKVQTFLTPHDAEESVGFVFAVDHLRFGYATDLGFMPSSVMNRLNGCSSVVLESNHDIYMLQTGPYPYPLKQRVRGARGHLSNDDSAYVVSELVKNGARKILLAHLSETNNTPGLALQCCTEQLRACGQNADVKVLLQEGHSEAFELE